MFFSIGYTCTFYIFDALTFLSYLTGLLAGGFRGDDNFDGYFLATTGLVRGDASFLTSVVLVRGDGTLLVLTSFLMKRGDAKCCLGLLLI